LSGVTKTSLYAGIKKKINQYFIKYIFKIKEYWQNFEKQQNMSDKDN